MKGTSYNKKGTFNIAVLSVANVNWFPPKSLLSYAAIFYIKAINSNNSKRRIIMIREDISISFFFILSPPFLSRSLAPPNLLNVPRYIITNKRSIINSDT